MVGKNLLIGNSTLSVLDIETGKYVADVLLSEDLINEKINNIKVIKNVLFLSLDDGIVTLELSEELLNTVPKSRDLFKNVTKEFEYNSLLNKNIPHGFFDIAQVGEYLWVSNPIKDFRFIKMILIRG